VRVQRELFLAVFGANVGAAESWVTDRLTSLLQEQIARADEKIFSAGDPPEYFYFLRNGRVELVHPGSMPWTYDGPTVFGMSDALLERPRVRTAVARTDIQAMRVQSEAWIELLEDSFPLAHTAIAFAVRATAELEEKLWARGEAVPNPEPEPYVRGEQLDLVERLAVLTGAPLLRGAGVQILGDLAGQSEVESFAPGDTLIERGRPPARVLLLLDGEVVATREAPAVSWRGGPGQVVCGTAAFGDSIAAWEARARSPGRALTFRVEDWMDLMEEHFEMVRATLGTLSLEREELLERLR
jgi:CRP-like cAMP-binding protein